MTIQFSERPGAWERHLRRKYRNPLFPDPAIGPERLREARERDADERRRFEGEFRRLMEKAAALRPGEGSEAVLRLKEELEMAYERCAGLAGDTAPFREALGRLIEAIMQAVRAGAGADPPARQELEQEAAARALHFELLAVPLVADLLRPDSPIAAAELVPTLLGEGPEALNAALGLFDPEQVATLCHDSRLLLERLRGQGSCPAAAWERLAEMEAAGDDRRIN